MNTFQTRFMQFDHIISTQNAARHVKKMKPIDMHVHLVGNGRQGSGCWLRVKGWHRPLAAFMLRHIGLRGSLSSAEFDPLYVENLLRLVQESSLGAIVILAQDQVDNDDGRLM